MQQHRNHYTGGNHHCVCLKHDRNHNNSDTDDDSRADHNRCVDEHRSYDNNSAN